jgi:VanZ family protein
MNAVNQAGILISFVIIAKVTLFPLDFTLEAKGLSWKLLILTPGTETDWEIVANSLLYFPLGFATSAYFRTQRMTEFKLFTLNLLISFALSYLCEVLQSFLPSRYPSWTDVGSNMAGGIFGYLFTFTWERKSPLLFLIVYFAAACLLAVFMQGSTGLKNWNTSYPLVIGNEHTGNRPWKGAVSEFYITRKAATENDIRRIFADRSPVPVFSDKLVVYYKKDGSQGYRDELGKSPPLEITHGSDNSGRQGSPWFETVRAPRDVTNQLVMSSQFTLGATITTQDRNQTGPARIISLSADANQRNFTLGQDGQDLIFRLRTSLTGANGSRPALRVPMVFSTPEVRHVVVTYDGTHLHVYVDGRKSPESLNLTPALFVYNSVRQVDVPSSKIATLLYCGIIFLPIGVMLFLALKQAKLNSDLHLILVGGFIVCVISMTLEGLLVFVSGRQMEAENILLGILSSCLSFLAANYLRNNLSCLLTQAAQHLTKESGG